MAQLNIALFNTSLFLLVLALAIATPARTSDFRIGDIAIIQPWARATPPGAPTGVGYLTLRNKGSKNERLLSASADISKTAELHTHVMKENVMMMRKVEFVEIPAGQEVLLEPGGLHLMFIALKAPLEKGQVFPLTLTFEKAGKKTVDVTVRK